MTCKVKIGSAYEPKWFERRQTNGWYSGKNVPLDNDQMWLQNALLGNRKIMRRKIRKIIFMSAVSVLVVVALFSVVNP
jgi:hypothetical protein